MTIDDFLEIGEVRSNMSSYRKKKQQALDLCCKMLEQYKRPYAAISGGKDSVAMACIIWEASKITGKPFDLWCHISDASFPGTRETVDQVAKMTKMDLTYYESAQSAFKLLSRKARQRFGKTGVFFDSIRHYVKSEKKDLAFVGVRAYESKRRMAAAKAHGQVFESNDMGGITVCNPLQWFRLEDVAAVITEYNAPIHPIYRKMATSTGKNVNDEEKWIRLGYITSKDLLNYGTVVFIKLNYPGIYAKLKQAYPEVGLYE